MQEKFKDIEETRGLAASALNSVLIELLRKRPEVSEEEVARLWKERLSFSDQIFESGWYSPPAGGIGIVFSSDQQTAGSRERFNYTSLRLPGACNKSDQRLDYKNGIAYCFASPVSKTSGMIGDFGVTLYFGKNPDVIEHLKTCLMVDRRIADAIEIGMPFRELYAKANRLFKHHGVANQVKSQTDPTGINIGHTIPASYENWSAQERSLLGSGDIERIKSLLSSKRRFVSDKESLTVQPGMALTIEPRLINPGKPSIPMSSFHTICLIDADGNKKLLTQFDRLFQTVGMDYMKDVR